MRMSVAYENRSSCSRQLAARRLPWQSLPGLGQRTCRGDAGVQVESRARHQHVQPQAQHADRLSLDDRVDGRIADVRPIDDGHATAPLDLDGVVGPDEGRRVLIEPDTDRERVVSERGEQAAQAVTLAEMLIDDEAVGEAQARREPHAAGDHGGALIARGDHVLGEDAGARAGAADGDATRVTQADELRDRRAAQQRREPQLVAPGEEDAARFLDALEASLLLAVAAGIEIHDGHARRADVREHLLVARAGLVHAAGGGDDDDVGLLGARDAHEALEDPAVILLVLRTADRNNPTTPVAIGDFAGHPGLTPLLMSRSRRYHGRWAPR